LNKKKSVTFHKLSGNLKSQITIFIVLGIVILIIFGLMFFIKNSTSEIVLEKKINKIYGDFLSTTGVKEYISVCLDRVTKDAILLSSLQGGKIYDYQVSGGYSIGSAEDVLPFNYSGFIFNVSYGIEKPVPDGGEYLSPPFYPYSGRLLEDPFNEHVSAGRYESVFGKKKLNMYNRYSSLTSLCNYYGSNYINISGAVRTCETISPINDSIQEYLTVFILNRTRECINFEQFTSGTRHNITEGNISASVLIGDNNIFVTMDYPVVITLKEKPPSVRFLDYTSELNIRLKRVHELAIHLIGSGATENKYQADANNIFFNLTRDDPHDCDINSINQPCIFPGMSVSRVRDPCLSNSLCDDLDWHHSHSDIINITDTSSRIDGVPLTFLFAVENRAPALNNTRDLNGRYFLNGRIEVTAGDNIEIFALDPDEDDLSYSINDANFIDIGGGVFTSGAVSDYLNLIINITDNEGLYDYQQVDIIVN